MPRIATSVPALVSVSAMLSGGNLVVFVVGGHGAGMIWQLMTSGDALSLSGALGWIGLLLQVATAFPLSKRTWCACALAGLLCLAISLGMIFHRSMEWHYFDDFVAMFLVPFFVTTCVRVVQIIFYAYEPA